MKSKKVKEQFPRCRLFLQIRDKSKEIIVREDGRNIIPTIWIEVQEVNLGSLKISNKDIFQIRIEPIKYEGEEDNKIDLSKFFKGFGI